MSNPTHLIQKILIRKDLNPKTNHKDHNSKDPNHCHIEWRHINSVFYSIVNSSSGSVYFLHFQSNKFNAYIKRSWYGVYTQNLRIGIASERLRIRREQLLDDVIVKGILLAAFSKNRMTTHYFVFYCIVNSSSGFVFFFIFSPINPMLI